MPVATPTSPVSPPTTAAPEFAAHASLLRTRRIEMDMPMDVVCTAVGVTEKRLSALEKGEAKPSYDEVERLAEFYHVSPRDLLPSTDDMKEAIQTLLRPDALVTQEKRDGEVVITRRHLVQTSRHVNIVPTELQIHERNRDRAAKHARGRHLHSFLYVLKGKVCLIWKHDGATHEEILDVGTTAIIPAMVPFEVYSPDKVEGMLLRVGYGQHLMNGDVRQELRTMGLHENSRVVEDGDYAAYYKKTEGIDLGPILYPQYAHLIRHWKNETKLTPAIIQEKTGIMPERFERLNNGQDKATLDELVKLSAAFGIDLRDLLPRGSDLDRGIRIQTYEQAPRMDQYRNDVLAYTYLTHARTQVLPNLVPVELDLHMTREQATARSNRGHFFSSFVYVLGGKVGGLSGSLGHFDESVLSEGDSTLTTSFTPHVFWSVPGEERGRMLSMTFGQYLANGDTLEEARLVGAENLQKFA